MGDSAGHSPTTTGPATPAQARVRAEGDRLTVALQGDWRTATNTPTAAEIVRQLNAAAAVRTVEFTAADLGDWDSRLLAFLLQCLEVCARGELQVKTGSLPAGLQQLLALAQAVPEKADARRTEAKTTVVQRLGHLGLTAVATGQDMLAFLGDCALAFGRLLRGTARLRWSDLGLVVQQTGAEALPIVALINLLVGLILGFVGAVQLQRFGASIYVADLVGIAITREMASMMTGIILCGRTGAAFAAQLGTMKVNEEIDALRALGISPIEFLVLPRMIALCLMMPLLCIFGIALGLLGGLLVAMAMLDLSFREYWNATVAAISLKNYFLGVGKGAFYGVLIALAGCMRGLQCGNNAAAVGQATTSAVVIGITSIIVADAVFAVLCNILGL